MNDHKEKNKLEIQNLQDAMKELDAKLTTAQTTIRRLEAEKVTQATELSDTKKALKRKENIVSKLNQTVAAQHKSTAAGQNKEIAKLQKELDEEKSKLDVEKREVIDLNAQLDKAKQAKVMHDYKKQADTQNRVLVSLAIDVRKAFMLRYFEKKMGRKIKAENEEIVEQANTAVNEPNGKVDYALFGPGNIWDDSDEEYKKWSGRFQEIYGERVDRWAGLSEKKKRKFTHDAKCKADFQEKEELVGSGDGGGYEEGTTDGWGGHQGGGGEWGGNEEGVGEIEWT